ncbi:hypothetical protein D3C77_496060 [compost metagenome]
MGNDGQSKKRPKDHRQTHEERKVADPLSFALLRDQLDRDRRGGRRRNAEGCPVNDPQDEQRCKAVHNQIQGAADREQNE